MVLGQRRRVILTHSPGLHAAQQAGFAQTLRKATAALTELAARLARGRTRRPPAKVQAEIDTICAPRWVARVIATELTGDTPATLRLAWRIDQNAHAGLEEAIFGKRILVTDHNDWPLEQVIDAYLSGLERRVARRLGRDLPTDVRQRNEAAEDEVGSPARTSASDVHATHAVAFWPCHAAGLPWSTTAAVMAAIADAPFSGP